MRKFFFILIFWEFYTLSGVFELRRGNMKVSWRFLGFLFLSDVGEMKGRRFLGWVIFKLPKPNYPIFKLNLNWHG